jgi:hypothetical protein
MGCDISKERLGDWDGQLDVYAPSCARQGVPHGQTESGGIVLAFIICLLGPERPN